MNRATQPSISDASVFQRFGTLLSSTASGITIRLPVLGVIGFFVALVNYNSEGMVLTQLAIALAVPIWLIGEQAWSLPTTNDTDLRSQVLAVLVLVIGVTQCWSQPQKGFLTGNDIYSFCQHDRSAALGYTAGLWDEAVHSSFVLDETRAPGPQGEALVRLGNRLLTGFCPPTDAILDQVTDSAARTCFITFQGCAGKGMAMPNALNGQ
jgi:hypothetical protein